MCCERLRGNDPSARVRGQLPLSKKARRKIHGAEKRHAIRTVTLDSARGLRFLSLLECQIYLSIALR